MCNSACGRCGCEGLHCSVACVVSKHRGVFKHPKSGVQPRPLTGVLHSWDVQDVLEVTGTCTALTPGWCLCEPTGAVDEFCSSYSCSGPLQACKDTAGSLPVHFCFAFFAFLWKTVCVFSCSEGRASSLCEHPRVDVPPLPLSRQHEAGRQLQLVQLGSSSGQLFYRGSGGRNRGSKSPQLQWRNRYLAIKPGGAWMGFTA